MVKCLEDRELKERSRTHWLRTASFMAGHDVFRLKIIIEMNFVICIMKARTYDIICFLSFSFQLSSEHKEHSHSCLTPGPEVLLQWAIGSACVWNKTPVSQR